MKRAITLPDGIAMVTTDLHGAGKVYRHLRDIFLREYEAGRVQRWILCGDLLHSNNPDDGTDESLPMLLDVMALQAKLGAERVVMLCGNHEMPHIYGQMLSKGTTDYTPPFEAALSALDADTSQPYRRADVSAFLTGLPFYAFTAAGVMFAHAGPAASVVTPEVAAQVLAFDHAEFLAEVDATLAKYDLKHAAEFYAQQLSDGKITYAQLAKHYLGVNDEQDPRYYQLLRAFIFSDSAPYDLLWDVLFTQNENALPNDMRRVTDYEALVKGFLAAFAPHLPSAYAPRVVVSGHMRTQGGHAVIDDRHLRLSSYEHASPKHAGEYLLLDCATPITDADALVPMLRKTFEANA